MAGEISKLPLGLLGLLGIKNGGAYPRELAGYYQPVLELLPWIAAANFEEANFAQNAVAAAGNAGSFSTAVQVAQTELWYVQFASLRVFTAAGEAFSGYLAVRRFPVSSPNIVMPLSEIVTVGASINGAPAVGNLYAPFILGPGDELVGYTLSVTGAPTWRGAFRFARLTI